MRKICIVVGIITLVLAIILLVFPFGSLVLAPAITALILSLIAFKSSVAEHTKLPKTLLILSVVVTFAGALRFFTSENKVAEDVNFEKIKETSQQEAIEELETLDVDLENIEE